MDYGGVGGVVLRTSHSGPAFKKDRSPFWACFWGSMLVWWRVCGGLQNPTSQMAVSKKLVPRTTTYCRGLKKWNRRLGYVVLLPHQENTRSI